MKRFNQETESILTNIKKAEITPNDSKNGKGKMNLLDANPTIFAYK